MTLASSSSRRRLLTLWMTPGLLDEDLTPTANEGPFYPAKFAQEAVQRGGTCGAELLAEPGHGCGAAASLPLDFDIC
jgi:hypothetical protein